MSNNKYVITAYMNLETAEIQGGVFVVIVALSKELCFNCVNNQK